MPKTEKNTEKKTALILKGGGVKGLALIGSIIELSKYGYKFDAFVGTSAGAIVAGLLAAGSSPEDLEKILRETDFRRFQDGKWYLLLWNILVHRYLNPGQEFENWIFEQIKKSYNLRKNLLLPPKMKDLSSETRLTIYAAQKNLGLIEFDSSPKTENSEVPVNFAIRCSMSIPLFFKSPEINGQSVYDGGIFANFPAKVWTTKNRQYDFIGIYLGDKFINPNNSKGVIGDLIETITNTNDAVFIDANRPKVVVVDPSPIGTTDFDLTKEEADFLVLQGRADTLRHLFRYLPEAKKPNENDVKQLEEEASEAKKKVIEKRKRRKTVKILTRTVSAIILLSSIAAFGWYVKSSLTDTPKNDETQVKQTPIDAEKQKQIDAEKQKLIEAEKQRLELDRIYDEAERNKKKNTEESLDRAIANYTDLITAEYKMVSAYDNRGDAYEKLAAITECKTNLENALSDYSSSIEVAESRKAVVDDVRSSPKFVLINRALANQKAGHLRRAVEDFFKVCDENNSSDKCSRRKEFEMMRDNLPKTGDEIEPKDCIGKNR